MVVHRDRHSTLPDGELHSLLTSPRRHSGVVVGVGAGQGADGHTQINGLFHSIYHTSRQIILYNIVRDDRQVEINEMSKI